MEILTINESVLFVVAIVCTLYMAWGIGTNDLSNTVGPAIGARALGIREAIIIAAVFEFAGALTFGSHVTETVSFNIIKTPIQEMGDASLNPLVYVMLASLLATSLWLTFASAKGWPVSTTHSIIGAILGSTISAFSVEAIEWNRLMEIFASWLVSPLLGALLAYLLMQVTCLLLLRHKSSVKKVRMRMPFFFFLCGFVVSMILVCKVLPTIDMKLGLTSCIVFSIIVGGGMAFINANTQNYTASSSIEDCFIPLVIITACLMAFAHGSNDIANVIGPLSVIVHSIDNGLVAMEGFSLPKGYYIIGGVGVVAGMATFGFRVVKTIGTHITQLTPSSVFCASLAATTTVLLATQLGLPVSTTHTVVGAILGVGLASGVQAVNIQTVRRIIVAWLITLPVTSLLAAILCLLFPLFL